MTDLKTLLADHISPTGKITLSHEALGRILAENFQFVTIGDTHSSLAAYELNANSDFTRGLAEGGISMRHIETDHSQQDRYADVNNSAKVLSEESLARLISDKLDNCNLSAEFQQAAEPLLRQYFTDHHRQEIAISAVDNMDAVREVMNNYPEEVRHLFLVIYPAFTFDSITTDQTKEACDLIEEVPQEVIDRVAPVLPIIKIMRQPGGGDALKDHMRKLAAEGNVDELSTFMAAVKYSGALMNEILPMITEVLQARDKGDKEIADRIISVTGDMKAVVAFGKAHMYGELDLDDMLPNSMFLSTENSVADYLREYADRADHPEIVYSAEDNNFYYSPSIPRKSEGKAR